MIGYVLKMMTANQSAQHIVREDGDMFDVLAEQFPYQFRSGDDFNANDTPDIYRWCENLWGDSALRFLNPPKDGIRCTIDKGGAYVVLFGTFYFRDQTDAAAFRIAWGGK